MESLTVRIGDKILFSMNQLHFEIRAPEDGQPMEFTGAAEKFGLNLLGVFFLAHHYGGSVKAADTHGKGVTYTIELPITAGTIPDVATSSEEFVTKVLMNDTLWEKLLSGV